MQELVLSEQQLMQFIGQYIWPMMRIGAVLLVMPVIGAQTVPARVRVLLALFITLLIVPLLPPPPAVLLFPEQAMAIGPREWLIGIAVCFRLQVVLTVSVLSAFYVGMIMAMWGAARNDSATADSG